MKRAKFQGDGKMAYILFVTMHAMKRLKELHLHH